MFPFLVRSSDFKLTVFLLAVKVWFFHFNVLVAPPNTVSLGLRFGLPWQVFLALIQPNTPNNGSNPWNFWWTVLFVSVGDFLLRMKYPNENHHFAPSFGQKMFFPPTQLPPKSKFCSGYRCWLPPSGMSIRLQIWICLVATSDAWQKPWPRGARPSKKKVSGMTHSIVTKCVSHVVKFGKMKMSSNILFQKTGVMCWVLLGKVMMSLPFSILFLSKSFALLSSRIDLWEIGVFFLQHGQLLYIYGVKNCPVISGDYLAAGFKYYLCSSLAKEMIQFD